MEKRRRKVPPKMNSDVGKMRHKYKRKNEAIKRCGGKMRRFYKTYVGKMRHFSKVTQEKCVIMINKGF